MCYGYLRTRKEGNLFNIAVNTVYLRLCVTVIYGQGRKEGNFDLTTLSTHYIYGYVLWLFTDKEHSESKIRNMLLPLHGLFVVISSKGSFICIIPQTGQYIPGSLLHTGMVLPLK